MLKKINQIEFEFIGNLKLSNEKIIDIKKFWNDYKLKNPEAYNGDILIAQNISCENEKCKITIAQTLFESYLYSVTTGKININSLFSAAYIITQDNYVGILLNNKNILNDADTLNLIGGMASFDDMENSNYDDKLSLIRECKEELGLDINNNSFEYKLKYVKFPFEKEADVIGYPIGTIYELKTTYTKNEISNIFTNSLHDKEVNKILFFNKDNYMESYNYKCQKPYIRELLELLFYDIK